MAIPARARTPIPAASLEAAPWNAATGAVVLAAATGQPELAAATGEGALVGAAPQVVGTMVYVV